MGVRNSKAGTKKRTKLGLELEQSAREILAHVGPRLHVASEEVIELVLDASPPAGL